VPYPKSEAQRDIIWRTDNDRSKKEEESEGPDPNTTAADAVIVVEFRPRGCKISTSVDPRVAALHGASGAPWCLTVWKRNQR